MGGQRVGAAPTGYVPVVSDTLSAPADDGPGVPRAAWGLVVAPIVFVVGWAVAGATVDGYSPRRQAISDLAAVDSPRRWPMFVVFLLYGLSMVTGSLALRQSVVRTAAVAAVVNGLAVIGVALTPIHQSSAIDDRHGTAALLAYISLAAMPILAAWGLARNGQRGAAVGSVVVGVASIVALSAAYGNDYVGFLQRSGTTIGNAWILAAGVAVLTGALTSRRARSRAQH